MCKKLEDVYCYAVTCPAAGSATFEFSNTDNATLHVPAESVNTYKSHDAWNKFKTVVPLTDEELAIEGVTAKNVKESIIYNLNGQQLTKTQKGLNIISGRKVLTK